MVMIKSMTGYGKGQAESLTSQIKVEIRSLNSKGLDLSFRCPNAYRDREMSWRKSIGDKVKRGKVDLNIHREVIDKPISGINIKWLQTIMSELQSVSSEPISNSDLLSMALKIPAQNIHTDILLNKIQS